jgi:hypothetical protein
MVVEEEEERGRGKGARHLDSTARSLIEASRIA